MNAKKTFLFHGSNLVNLNRFALLLEEKIFLADQILIEQDASGGVLYLTASGEVAIVANDNGVSCRGNGEFVGEIAIFPGERRIATMKALGQPMTLTRSLN